MADCLMPGGYLILGIKESLNKSGNAGYSERVIVIGGSAGSYKTLIELVKQLPSDLNIPVFLCLHRLKNLRKGIAESLDAKSQIPVIEPEDKDSIRPGILYLAPSNYHMLVSPTKYISLSTDALRNHSRPSIDLLFITAAEAYGELLIGILLSGASTDGTEGAKYIKKKGGSLIIQDPDDCEIRTMTESALQNTNPDSLLSAKQIIDFVSLLKSQKNEGP